jgi:hypothetical protein
LLLAVVPLEFRLLKAIIKNLLRGDKMEQQIGNYVKADETFSGGIATAKVTAAVPQTSYGLKLNVTIEADMDAGVLIGYLAGKIGGPVPAEVASFIQLALKAT